MPLNALVCSLFITLALCSSAVCAEKSPNIVFLFADDQRADTIGAHGNPHIQTPNLDKLALEGFSFRRNYCAGSFSAGIGRPLSLNESVLARVGSPTPPSVGIVSEEKRVLSLIAFAAI